MTGEVTTNVLMRRTGLTFRQLDFWCRQGYLRPIERTGGTGVPRSFPTGELAVAMRMRDLVGCGIKPSTACKLARGDEALLRKLEAALSSIRVATGVTVSTGSLTVATVNAIACRCGEYEATSEQDMDEHVSAMVGIYDGKDHGSVR